MNVRKRKQAERKYREEHKEELEKYYQEHEIELQAVYDATHNPDKKFWDPRYNNILKHPPGIIHNLGNTFYQALKNLKKVYVEKGWMNESGEWIQ